MFTSLEGWNETAFGGGGFGTALHWLFETTAPADLLGGNIFPLRLPVRPISSGPEGLASMAAAHE